MSWDSHPMADAALERQNWESLGHGGDQVYIPGPEDDMSDPETREVIEMTMENYAHNNARRQEESLRAQNSALRGMLEENGITVPDDL